MPNVKTESSNLPMESIGVSMASTASPTEAASRVQEESLSEFFKALGKTGSSVAAQLGKDAAEQRKDALEASKEANVSEQTRKLYENWGKVFEGAASLDPEDKRSDAERERDLVKDTVSLMADPAYKDLDVKEKRQTLTALLNQGKASFKTVRTLDKKGALFSVDQFSGDVDTKFLPEAEQKFYEHAYLEKNPELAAAANLIPEGAERNAFINEGVVASYRSKLSEMAMNTEILELNVKQKRNEVNREALQRTRGMLTNYAYKNASRFLKPYAARIDRGEDAELVASAYKAAVINDLHGSQGWGIYSSSGGNTAAINQELMASLDLNVEFLKNRSPQKQMANRAKVVESQQKLLQAEAFNALTPETKKRVLTLDIVKDPMSWQFFTIVGQSVKYDRDPYLTAEGILNNSNWVDGGSQPPDVSKPSDGSLEKIRADFNDGGVPMRGMLGMYGILNSKEWSKEYSKEDMSQLASFYWGKLMQMPKEDRAEFEKRAKAHYGSLSPDKEE